MSKKSIKSESRTNITNSTSSFFKCGSEIKTVLTATMAMLLLALLAAKMFHELVGKQPGPFMPHPSM